MSFEDITIHRAYPIINGYVQVPHNKETDKTRVTVDEAIASISGSEQVWLSKSTGQSTGASFGSQSFLMLPETLAREFLASNPVDEVVND